MSSTPGTSGGQEAPGPLVWVELPDGQTVTAEMLARIQQRSGEWWYELRISLWAELQLPSGKTAPEPFAVTFRAPAGKVTPIEGTDYSAVRTQRPRPPTRDRLAAELTGHFSRQRVRTPAGQKPAWIIHYEGCWLATEQATLTLDQARRAVFEGAEPCGVCEAQQLYELRTPPPSTH
ncbi:DUF6233 domain-containing protein [Streptomyces cinnamoneus]|uniref:DUF6233 domain-containing protein n=1 Tax=Streptomyces cinnamoneus TaxID=53446 RepID=UPI00343BC7AF